MPVAVHRIAAVTTRSCALKLDGDTGEGGGDIALGKGNVGKGWAEGVILNAR